MKKSTTELLKKIRRDWNGTSPVTKVVPSKKIYNRKKEKIKYE